jgi:hypothetical protein
MLRMFFLELPSILEVLKVGTLLANILCFCGVFYGRQIYDREDMNPRRVHLFSITFIVIFLLYLSSMTIFSIYLLFIGHFFYASLFLFFITSPFIIGVLGNNFDRAKIYFNLQLFILFLSLLVLVFLLEN